MAATGTGQTSVRGPQQAAVIGSGQKHSLPSLRRPVALCLATLRDNISSPLGRCLPKRKKVDGSAASGQASMGNYQTFANFLGKHADMNMFRRFGSLQAQNILFFQAELAYLEDELCVIRERRASGDPEKEHAKERHSKCFRDLQKDGESSEEFKKTMEIRAKLNEYNAALLQYHELCNLQRPTNHDLDALRYWLNRPEGGDFLEDVEGDAWDEEQVPSSDLVAMRDAHRERDIFSDFLANKFLTAVHRIRTWRQPSLRLDPEMAGLGSFDETKFNTFTQVLGTLIASMLPAVAIIVLYFIPSTIERLWTIMAFSALFSFTLKVFTNARGAETFAATAAFASVQVVFVGTTGGPPMPPTA